MLTTRNFAPARRSMCLVLLLVHVHVHGSYTQHRQNQLRAAAVLLFVTQNGPCCRLCLILDLTRVCLP